MKKAFLKSYIFILALVFFIAADNRSCDTSNSFGENYIKCIKADCPRDSIIFTYIDNNFISERHFPGCGNRESFISYHENGDTLTCSNHIGKNTVGLRRIYYTGYRPERFTNFDSTGRKHGWEVFWYENGNVKDSILFRNDSTIQRSSFYHNGKVSIKEKDIYGNDGYDAVSFTPEGKKSGEIQNGTGTVFVCDSVGGNCKKLTFKGGKRVFE